MKSILVWRAKITKANDTAAQIPTASNTSLALECYQNDISSMDGMNDKTRQKGLQNNWLPEFKLQ